MKGKQGKYCPFRENHKCGDYCGLFCIGLNSCVFHAINKNLMDGNILYKENCEEIKKEMKEDNEEIEREIEEFKEKYVD